MLGGSPESTSPHAPMLSSAIPIVITRGAIVSPRCNGFRERAAAALHGLPLPRLDVIHEVVVSDRSGCAARHSNVRGAEHPPAVEHRDPARGQEIEPLLD